jgi:hypothetical protein
MWQSGCVAPADGNPSRDFQAERERLRLLREHIESEYDRLYKRMANQWSLSIGPKRLTRNVSSQAIFWLYVSFLAAAALTGTLLIVLNVVLPMGIALLVGSLFAGGSFVSQVWSLTLQSERKAHDSVYGDMIQEWMRELVFRMGEVAEELEKLDQDERRQRDE